MADLYCRDRGRNHLMPTDPHDRDPCEQAFIDILKSCRVGERLPGFQRLGDLGICDDE